MDQVLIVTGGSRGIGAATARLAAQRGYSVCVNVVRNEAALAAVVRNVEAIGGRAARQTTPVRSRGPSDSLAALGRGVLLDGCCHRCDGRKIGEADRPYSGFRRLKAICNQYVRR